MSYPWTLVGWVVLICLLVQLIAMPFVIIWFVAARKRSIAAFEARRREGIR